MPKRKAQSRGTKLPEAGQIAEESSIVLQEDDGGKARGRSERQCALTRQVRPVGDLIRFVVGPEAQVVPDIKAVLPGRGVWVSARRQAIEEAIKKRVFSRAFKRDVQATALLAAHIDTLLLERARDSVSLANKAGMVTSGFVQVEAALRQGAIALFHACGAAEDGSAKLDRQLRAMMGAHAPIIKVFSGSDLDLALGRSNVVHAALSDGSAARACLARIAFLSAYREHN